MSSKQPNPTDTHFHHPLPMANQDWDGVRRSVRNLENELDQKISSYSKLSNQLSTAYYSSQTSSSLASSRQDARTLEMEIAESLDKVSGWR